MEKKERRHLQRQEAKLARGRGQKAIAKAGVTDAQWAAKHDPLFMVRGKTRWEWIWQH